MTRVLYVDDESAIGRVVQEWLQRAGVEVHLAHGVRSAEQSCRAHRFDGIFIDIWLPDGTGFDLFSWIETRDPALAGRAAFVTGDSVPRAEDQARLTAIGRRVLVKPFDLRDVERIVREWQGEAEEARQLPGHPADRHAT